MSASEVIEGPTRMTCPEGCEVPEGTRLAVVPVPRHAWGDVIVCPNDGCGLAFLVIPAALSSVSAPDKDTER